MLEHSIDHSSSNLAGVPIDVTFKGALRIDQKPAVTNLKKSDTGILAGVFRRQWIAKMDGIRSS